MDSSLWEESGDVVKVFFTMVATKDADHVCRLDAYRIAKKCYLDELYVLEIIKVLASPDKRRKSKQEFEGRRIKVVEDGWLVLNGEKYRTMVQDEMKKARWRRAQAAKRAREKGGTSAERHYVKAVQNGEVDPQSGLPYTGEFPANGPLPGDNMEPQI